MKTAEKVTGLALLREPFPDHQISKLPKGTKAQNECNASEKTNCKICGGWHHPRIVHLDYVGHAALTDRLLDADPAWNWEFAAVNADGTPIIDKDGGFWIRLTVCGVTRLGYGDAQGKTGGNAMKERIGDALRNAAMRFGAALDLWHKGELHAEPEEAPAKPAASKSITASVFDSFDASTQEALRNSAMGVLEAFVVSADEGFDQYQTAKKGYDADTQTAFWNLLDSKTRSSIKKTGEARKAQQIAD